MTTNEQPPAERSPGVQAWDLMTEIWKSCKPWMEQVAASFALTPQQLIAVKMLGEGGPQAMSELALSLGCDASNVTSLVDKLETRGLVERRSAPHDRRVKSIVLTDDGAGLYASAKGRFSHPPPVFANLELRDQEALCEIFQRALMALDGTPLVRETAPRS